jgi:hypothetical protein
MTERQAAEVLGVSLSAMRRWRLQKRGPRFVKVESAVRYDPRDVEDYVQSGKSERPEPVQ